MNVTAKAVNTSWVKSTEERFSAAFSCGRYIPKIRNTTAAIAQSPIILLENIPREKTVSLSEREIKARMTCPKIQAEKAKVWVWMTSRPWERAKR